MSFPMKLRSLAARAVYGVLHPGVTIWNPDAAEMAHIRSAGFHGQAGQDYFIFKRYFEGHGRTGVYVDVGANEPVENSNTCYFDRVLGWRGVAVEPLNRFSESWARERSAKLLAVAATESRKVLRFEEVISDEGTPFSSVLGNSSKNGTLERRTIEVQGERLDTLLIEEGLLTVDVMSIDVEGHEMEVLKGLDLSKIKVSVLIIENNVPAFRGRQDIRDYLKACGYRLDARIWHLDDVFVRV